MSGCEQENLFLRIMIAPIQTIPRCDDVFSCIVLVTVIPCYIIVITSYNVLDLGSDDCLPSTDPPTFYKPDDCSLEKALVQGGVLQAPHADYMSQWW